MKLLKFAAFFFAALFAGLLSAQDQQSSQKNPDRSYVGDYSDKPSEIMLVDAAANKERKVTLKSSSAKDFVFADSAGGELTVPKDTKTFHFAVHGGENWNRARAAFNRGNWNEALVYMRPVVYPLLQYTPFSEETFRVHGYVEMLITALLNDERLVEAEALVDALPLGDSPLIVPAALEVANALADAGKVESAMKIVNRVSLSADEPDNIAAYMKTLDRIRLRGVSKDLLMCYTKLSNMNGNPQKDVATLWMIYCDMSLGNNMSAQVYLSSLKVPQDSEEFSLSQMLKGMYKEVEKKIPDALDMYAEGIVFGKISSDWMPELLYKTGMAYKKSKNFVAANEIFLQINALYPDSVFAPKAKAEFVKIEKPKKTEDEE